MTSKKALALAILAAIFMPVAILYFLSERETVANVPAVESPSASDKPMKMENHHDHAKILSLPEGTNAPTLKVNILSDAAGGWNVHIITENFKFAPEHVNEDHIAGEGHAHIYVNDKKLARIYGPWFHVGSLPKGALKIRVDLNANNHQTLAVGEKPLSVTTDLTVQ